MLSLALDCHLTMRFLVTPSAELQALGLVVTTAALGLGQSPQATVGHGGLHHHRAPAVERRVPSKTGLLASIETMKV